MKYKAALFLCSFLMVSIIYAQRDSSYKVRVDTLKIQNIASKAAGQWYENAAMPWLSAILIALIGVWVNLFIAKRTREISLKAIEEQIKNSTKLAASQFTATLYSSNRQEWINSVRETISELVTQCTLLNIVLQEKDDQRKHVVHEKVTLHRNKLRLYLSSEIELHKKVLDDVKELMNKLDRHLLNSQRPVEDFDNVGIMRLSDKIIESGRIMLYAEWGKIQEAQKKH